MPPIRISILGSTRGGCLQPLVDAINNSEINAKVVLVLSNNRQSGILKRAEEYKLTNVCLSSAGLNRKEHETKLNQILIEANTDLIILLGYMRILTPVLINSWSNKILNVHPSLLPKHKGLMDLTVHQAVLDNNEGISGCSVHYVTEQVDGGQVLVQKQCHVLPNDTAESLKQRVQALEVSALITAIGKINHEFKTQTRTDLSFG